jgi:hypothetical protein
MLAIFCFKHMMASNKSSKNKVLYSAMRKRISAQNKRKSLSLIATMAGIAVVTPLLLSSPRVPMHTSILTGRAWLDELLVGHPERFKRQLGVAKHVFHRLSKELQQLSGLCNSKYVTADEQLAIFLHLARTGDSNRMLQERFQCGGETISKYLLHI